MKTEENTSFAFGFFPVIELLKRRKEEVVTIYVSEESVDSDGFRKVQELSKGIRTIVSSKAIRRIAKKENGHVMAEFRRYSMTLSSTSDHLVMANPMDMGNLGNAMRTLLAFGFHDLAIIKPACDFFSPKTIRASMGACFAINIEEFDSFEEYLNRFKRDYYPFILRKAKPLRDVRFSTPVSLVFGNEASGLPENYDNENAVRIEQSDEVDSLNLTTSIAIALYRLKMDRESEK